MRWTFTDYVLMGRGVRASLKLTLRMAVWSAIAIGAVWYAWHLMTLA